MLGRLTCAVRAHGCLGYGMLRNKDGIKKDDTDNDTDDGLVLSIVLPQHTEISAVPVNMGFDGSVKSRRRSRDPKRRDERIFQCDAKSERLPSRAHGLSSIYSLFLHFEKSATFGTVGCSKVFYGNTQ
jgi:hypothetical protein